MNIVSLVCAKSAKILSGVNTMIEVIPSLVSWKTLLEQAMKSKGESFNDLVKITLTEDELNVLFDDDYGFPSGKPFFAWTKNRVYFPATYDGAEWVASVPRNPTVLEEPYHIGG